MTVPPAPGTPGSPPPSLGRALVVDDDPNVVDVVARYLEATGFEVERAGDGPGAVAAAERFQPDLLVLDLMLPGFDGLEVFRRVRADRDVPVMMLTALDSEEDRLAGLVLGADDYITKPFSAKEVALRARNLVRRMASATPAAAELPARLQAADLDVDTVARRATRNGEPLALTTLEFDLLSYLMANAGRACGRDELFEKVWGYTIGDTATVTVHVRRLREKVEDDPTVPTRIVTVWGFGYRFEA